MEYSNRNLVSFFYSDYPYVNVPQVLYKLKCNICIFFFSLNFWNTYMRVYGIFFCAYIQSNDTQHIVSPAKHRRGEKIIVPWSQTRWLWRFSVNLLTILSIFVFCRTSGNTTIWIMWRGKEKRLSYTAYFCFTNMLFLWLGLVIFQ